MAVAEEGLELAERKDESQLCRVIFRRTMGAKNEGPNKTELIKMLTTSHLFLR